ncbi:MAG: PQQ-dependent sugar dehydrogenase [Flavitalea sp.]
MKRITEIWIWMIAVIVAAIPATANDSTKISPLRSAAVADITLPSGFSAASLIESGAKNRHIVINANGDVYVKLASLKNGKGILVLRDKSGKGKLELVNSFGDYGGTGLFIKNGYLYASSNTEVFRYKFNAKNEIDPKQVPEKLVTGLVASRQHETKSIALDNDGNIYVNIGAPSNSCQVKDREKGSLGQDPCSLLEKAAGIWQFKADKLNQSYAEGVHYATGTRNIVGLDWNVQSNELFAMQHGRDGLFQMFPEMYDEMQGAEIPAEEMLRVKKGSNFGWPYCYYDPFQSKKILAPEYGGDSKKQGRCEGVDTPAVAFPAHWAPNALLFYTGDAFPEKYKNGAFIAFHGSWNRAPQKQKGYKVVFVPFKDGSPSGDYEIFADGFMGAEEISSPGDAKYRPCGLAQAPDGSLYISDDVKGAIWKITYHGNK